MRITTQPNEINKARQFAGPLPEGAEIVGAVVESDDGRDYAAVLLMPTGLYVTQLGQAVRTIDQRRVHRALDAAERGSRTKNYSQAERKRRRRRLAEARKHRHE